MLTSRNFWIIEVTFYIVEYLDATLMRFFFFSSEISLSKDFILTLKIVVQSMGKFVLER